VTQVRGPGLPPIFGYFFRKKHTPPHRWLGAGWWLVGWLAGCWLLGMDHWFRYIPTRNADDTANSQNSKIPSTLYFRRIATAALACWLAAFRSVRVAMALQTPIWTELSPREASKASRMSWMAFCDLQAQGTKTLYCEVLLGKLADATSNYSDLTLLADCRLLAA